MHLQNSAQQSDWHWNMICPSSVTTETFKSPSYNITKINFTLMGSMHDDQNGHSSPIGGHITWNLNVKISNKWSNRYVAIQASSLPRTNIKSLLAAEPSSTGKYTLTKSREEPSESWTEIAHNLREAVDFSYRICSSLGKACLSVVQLSPSH